MTFHTFADTGGCLEAPPLPHKTTWQPGLTPSKGKDFEAFPTDTAKPEESQRLETIHMLEPQNEHSVRDFLQFWQCVFIRVFQRSSKFATSKSMFRAMRPKKNISHKMPRLPRNLHLATPLRSPDNAIRRILEIYGESVIDHFQLMHYSAITSPRVDGSIH